MRISFRLLPFLLGALVLLSSSPAFSVEDKYVGVDRPMYETTDYSKAALHRSTGAVVPKDWKARLKKLPPLDMTKLYKGDLPAAWDWRQVGVGPIRDQGNCGSCWAFSMTATLTDVLYLKRLGPIDLAEQLLVSCDKANSGCSGGWMEMSFFKANGSTLEENFPYTASNARCKSVPLIHKIKDWHYVSTSDEIPSTELLKRVIYTWGPISVAVSATGDFMNYRSGIYNGNSSGSINHAVNLVGWDDNSPVPHWIMRNSWSESWGEKGWMKIAYGAKQIGYAATYLDYDGKEIVPDPVPPDPCPPGPPCPTPPPCEDCTFWKWFAGLFG